MSSDMTASFFPIGQQQVRQALTTSIDMRESSTPELRRALVIERDDDYAALIATLLGKEGWQALRERDTRSGLDRLNAERGVAFEIILVNTPADPINGGRSALSALRGASRAPLIALCDEETTDERAEQGIMQAMEDADYNLSLIHI